MSESIRSSENNVIIKIKIKDCIFEIVLEKDELEFIDGCAVINFKLMNKFFVSAIIDQNYNLLTPLIVNENKMQNIVLLKNKKAIYEIPNENKDAKIKYALIDISSVKKITSENKILINNIIEFDGYTVFSGKQKMIILIDGQYKMYDLLSNKMLDFNFKNIFYDIDEDKKLSRYAIIDLPIAHTNLPFDVYYGSENVPCIPVMIKLNDEGNFENPIYFDEKEYYINEKYLYDQTKIAEMIIDDVEYEIKSGVLCKIKQ